MLRPAFRLEVTIHDQATEGDKVVTRMSQGGTHRGDFLGVPATGRTVEWNVIDIIRLRDGGYIEHWADMTGLRAQLTAKLTGCRSDSHYSVAHPHHPSDVNYTPTDQFAFPCRHSQTLVAPASACAAATVLRPARTLPGLEDLVTVGAPGVTDTQRAQEISWLLHPRSLRSTDGSRL